MAEIILYYSLIYKLTLFCLVVIISHWIAITLLQFLLHCSLNKQSFESDNSYLFANIIHRRTLIQHLQASLCVDLLPEVSVSAHVNLQMSKGCNKYGRARAWSIWSQWKGASHCPPIFHSDLSTSCLSFLKLQLLNCLLPYCSTNKPVSQAIPSLWLVSSSRATVAINVIIPHHEMKQLATAFPDGVCRIQGHLGAGRRLCFWLRLH